MFVLAKLVKCYNFPQKCLKCEKVKLLRLISDSNSAHLESVYCEPSRSKHFMIMCHILTLKHISMSDEQTK